MKNVEENVTDPKILCLVVLGSDAASEPTKKELEEAVAALKTLCYWKIEKVAVLEDRRMWKI